MTQDNQELNPSAPMSIYLCLESALLASNWMTKSDIGTIALARRLAIALDVCFDSGEIRDVPALAAKYLNVMQQLQLTVQTRVDAKQGDEINGDQHVGDYLRLISASDTKQKPKPTDRGAVSK